MRTMIRVEQKTENRKGYKKAFSESFANLSQCRQQEKAELREEIRELKPNTKEQKFNSRRKRTAVLGIIQESFFLV